MTPEAARLDLRSIMAQYDDAKDEWDQAELWEHIPGLVSRIRDLEKQVIQSATATTLAQLDVRVAERRVDAFKKDADDFHELKGWIRLCDDNPAGHAEFYQWASHYFFGTPEPEETS